MFPFLCVCKGSSIKVITCNYFCLFSLLTLYERNEIKVLEKGLGFVPTPNIINEEDLRRDFGEFSRKMRCKWYFKDEPSPNFSEVPAF